jgi:hypothetical protein
LKGADFTSDIMNYSFIAQSLEIGDSGEEASGYQAFRMA